MSFERKRKRDIVCVSMTTWEGDYMKAIVHMMSQLANNHRILFIDYAFTWKDVIYGLLGKSNVPVARMMGLRSRLRMLSTRQGNTIHHLTLPPVVPINWVRSHWLFSRLLKWQVVPVISSIRRSMQQLNFRNTIMINAFHPVMGVALFNQLDIAATYYYCYDEIRAANWAGVHGGRFEDDFFSKVDQVIVTSTQLQDNRNQKHRMVTLIENGVDYELFSQAFNSKKRNEYPIIGYLGSIDDRLDYDLLEFLVQSRPDWLFHFVGRVTFPKGMRRLDYFENVSFFGPQQPDDIPKYLRLFDAGLIPFIKNEFTKNIYPLKINEYLAAGIPVISTDFACLANFGNNVSIGITKEEFLDQLEGKIKSHNHRDVNQRIAMAKSNSWEIRAGQLNEMIK